MPVHTRSERRRAGAKRRSERQAVRRRAVRLRHLAGVIVIGICAAWLWQAGPAAASPAPLAAVSTSANLYRDFVARQAASLVRPDHSEQPHDEGPDITQDAFVPYIVTGIGPTTVGRTTVHDRPFYSLPAYARLLPGRADEIPHNELLDPAGYPGDWPYAGTASNTTTTGAIPSGGTDPWL